jgi:hypothetical protein
MYVELFGSAKALETSLNVNSLLMFEKSSSILSVLTADFTAVVNLNCPKFKKQCIHICEQLVAYVNIVLTYKLVGCQYFCVAV